MKEDGVRILNILGREYSIRASASEEGVLLQAAALLKERLGESQQRFPSADRHELLVLTALNLCVPLLQQGEQLREVQERLSATVELLRRQLRS